MPAGLTADPEPKSEAQLRREAAKAQLDAENAAEAESAAGRASLEGSTVVGEGESMAASARPSEDDTLREEPRIGERREE